MAALKPQPMLYEPDVSHMDICTLCINQEAARSAARSHELELRSGAPHVLMDEAALDWWAPGVVLELERPRKARASFRMELKQC